MNSTPAAAGSLSLLLTIERIAFAAALLLFGVMLVYLLRRDSDNV